MLHDNMPLFPLAPCFMTFLLGHAQKVTYAFRLFFFYFILLLSFFSFPCLFAAVIDLLLGLHVLPSQEILRKDHRDSKFYHGVATCSCRQFCSEFFTQISGYFCAYFRLQWADHSDLDITGKIFSSCRT